MLMKRRPFFKPNSLPVTESEPKTHNRPLKERQLPRCFRRTLGERSRIIILIITSCMKIYLPVLNGAPYALI